MFKLLYLILLLAIVTSCVKDDYCDSIDLPPSPSIKVAVVDKDSNSLVFGESPKYPFDSISFYKIFDTDKYKYIPNVSGDDVGDSFFWISHTGYKLYTINYSNGGIADTIEFVKVRTEKGRCFGIDYYNVYLNSILKFQDIRSHTNQPLYIIK